MDGVTAGPPLVSSGGTTANIWLYVINVSMHLFRQLLEDAQIVQHSSSSKFRFLRKYLSKIEKIKTGNVVAIWQLSQESFKINMESS